MSDNKERREGFWGLTMPAYDGFKLVAVMPPIDVVGVEKPPPYMQLVSKCVSHLVHWPELDDKSMAITERQSEQWLR